MAVVDPVVMRRLKQFHPERILFGYLFDLSVIALAIAITLQSYWFYPIAIFVIAARQHGMGVLMHEGVHFLIFKNKKLNDAVTRYFLSLPLFISMKHFRSQHLAHHAHTNDPVHDPDWARRLKLDGWIFPMSPSHLFSIFLKDFFLLNTFEMVQRFSGQQSHVGARLTWMEFITTLLYYSVVAFVLFHFHIFHLFLLFWVLPMLMPLKVIRRIRGISEHHGMVVLGTRTVIGSKFDRFFLSPWNINLHIEHHRFPQVPCFGLTELHECLMKDSEFKKTAAIYPDYYSVYKECTRPIESPSLTCVST